MINMTTSPIHNVHSLFLAERPNSILNSVHQKVFKLAENQLHCFHSNGSDLTFCVEKTRPYDILTTIF